MTRHFGLPALRPSVLLVVLLLSVASSAWAQRPKTFRIGILTDAMKPWHSTSEGFRDGLEALGYVEGKNVIFDARAARGDVAQVPALAAALQQQNPDLILCISNACRKDAGPIPMVFVQVSDPVRLGLVTSIARPGGNVTGIANLRAELTAKRLELFKEAVPGLRRVLVTYDPRETDEQDSVAVARATASRLRLTLLERPVSATLAIEPGLAELAPGGQDGILIVQAGTNLNIPGRSLEVATSERIPTMYPASFWANVGALASFGPDQYTQGRQAARLAHKVLTGTAPRDLPVELPDRIELIINLKTAQRLGLKIPQSILLRADRVVE